MNIGIVFAILTIAFLLVWFYLFNRFIKSVLKDIRKGLNL